MIIRVLDCNEDPVRDIEMVEDASLKETTEILQELQEEYETSEITVSVKNKRICSCANNFDDLSDGDILVILYEYDPSEYEDAPMPGEIHRDKDPEWDY